MAASIIQFPRPRRAVVYIEPVPDDGGSWAVLVQRPGHAAERAALRFELDSAMAAARRIAEQFGADFLDDVSPDQPGAA